MEAIAVLVLAVILYSLTQRTATQLDEAPPMTNEWASKGCLFIILGALLLLVVVVGLDAMFVYISTNEGNVIR